MILNAKLKRKDEFIEFMYKKEEEMQNYILRIRGVVEGDQIEILKKNRTIAGMKRYLKLYGNDRKALMEAWKKSDWMLKYYITLFKAIDQHAEAGLNNPLTTTARELRTIREIILTGNPNPNMTPKKKAFLANSTTVPTGGIRE